MDCKVMVARRTQMAVCVLSNDAALNATQLADEAYSGSKNCPDVFAFLTNHSFVG